MTISLFEFRNHRYQTNRLFKGDQQVWVRNAQHYGTQAFIWSGYKDGAVYAQCACHWAFLAFPELREE